MRTTVKDIENDLRAMGDAKAPRPRVLFMTLETMTSLPKEHFRGSSDLAYYRGIRIITLEDDDLLVVAKELRDFFSNGGIDMPEGKCDIENCKGKGEMGFYGKQVCKKHWEMDGKKGFNLKLELGVKDHCSVPGCGKLADKEMALPNRNIYLCTDHAPILSDPEVVSKVLGK